MTVRVLLFASYAEAVGSTELALEMPANALVGDVLAKVRAMSHTRALPLAPLVAVNASYASPTQVLSAGDEVAIIPPVAGG